MKLPLRHDLDLRNPADQRWLIRWSKEAEKQISSLERILSRVHHVTFSSHENAIQHDFIRQLSKQETMVLYHIADGQPNKQIGQALRISEQTVKNHITHILQKLQANDRTQAVVVAQRRGMIDLRFTLKEAILGVQGLDTERM